MNIKSIIISYILTFIVFMLVDMVWLVVIAKKIYQKYLGGFYPLRLTYDLTNLATLKDWPLPIVFIDIAWGSVLSALVSFAGFQIVKWIN